VSIDAEVRIRDDCVFTESNRCCVYASDLVAIFIPSFVIKMDKCFVVESTEEFVNGKITKLFGMAVAYQKCMTRYVPTS